MGSRVLSALSLCSGIGGIDYGFKTVDPIIRTVCYVEKDQFCQDILLARMADGVLDRAPIWDDLTKFDGRRWRGLVDLVHGGYPCQPFSTAGKRAGINDPRYLWPDVARIMAEIQPTYGFFENVGGHLSLGFREVAQDLESMGYCVSAGLFTAAEVGAPHRRQRLFVLARRQQESGFEEEFTGPQCSSATEVWPPGPEDREAWQRILTTRPELAPAVADASGRRRKGSLRPAGWRSEGAGEVDPDWRIGGTSYGVALEPIVRRVVDGLPRRVDRLKALGNAVVPEVVALAWTTLLGQYDTI